MACPCDRCNGAGPEDIQAAFDRDAGIPAGWPSGRQVDEAWANYYAEMKAYYDEIYVDFDQN